MKTSHPELNQLYVLSKQAPGPANAGLADQWRELALRDLPALTEWISEQPLDQECRLFEIYFALCLAEPLPQGFLSREFQRLYQLAVQVPSNANIYRQLEAFAVLNADEPGELVRNIVDCLLQGIQADSWQIRRFSAWLAGDFIGSCGSGLVDLLRQRCQQDPDWLVRFFAQQSLRHLAMDKPQHERPPPLSFADRLRIFLLGEPVADGEVFAATWSELYLFRPRLATFVRARH